MAIPVLIVTGFLGGGKTTLLRRILPFCRDVGKRPALIINEVGDADIDGALLADLYTEQMTLVGGCVCCTLQSRLAEALYQIVDERTYDLIILECSGLSNPVDVISVLSTPALVSKLGVSHCLCVVDAAHVEKMLQAAELAKAQVATADILLMNKEDRLAPQDRETVSALLRAHAPHAEFHWTTFGDLDETACRRLLTDPVPTHQVCTCGHHHHAHVDHHHAHTHTLPASFYTVAVPLPDLPNRASAESLLRALPSPVIRAKGFIHLADGGWHVLHRVYDAIDVTPYAVAPSTGPLLICIGQQLHAETIRTAVAEIGEAMGSTPFASSDRRLA